MMRHLTLITSLIVAVQTMAQVSAGSAATWYDRGYDYIHLGMRDSACVALYRAARAYAAVGDDSGEARSLMSIGDLIKYDDDQSEALRLLMAARAKAVSAGDDATLISTLDALRYIYHCRNDMESYGLASMALDSLYAVTTDERAKQTYSLRRGVEARNSGDYVMAEHFFNRYMAAARLSGSDTLSAAHTYNINMAVTKREAKQFDEAIAYAEKYKDISHTLFAADNARWYSPYREIALTYQEAGDSALAFAATDSLFAMLSLPATDAMERAAAYIVRGLCHARFGNYPQALADYEAADSQTAQGQSHIYHLSLLALRGGALTKMDRFDEALPLYEQYAAAVKERSGATSTNYARALVYLANVQGFLGMVDSGCDLYAEAAHMLMANFREQLRHVSAAERQSYWTDMSYHLFKMTGYAVKAGYTSNAFTRVCYDVLLFSKALLLESERSMYAVLRAHGTEQDIDDFARLSTLRTKAKDLECRGGGDEAALGAIYQRMRDIDSRLTQHSKAYSDYTLFLDTDYDDIRASLGDDDVLVDFFDYQVDGSDDHKHVAYIVRRDMDYPQIVEVLSPRQIDSLRALSPDGRLHHAVAAGSLVSLLWQPIAPFVRPGATIYYVPSGMTYRMALEALPGDDGQMLAAPGRIVRLSSARQIAARRPTMDGYGSAVLYGGLTYDVSPQVMAMESSRYDVAPLLATRCRPASVCRAFTPLANTKREVDTIGGMLRSNGYDVLTLSGVQGTQESFVSMDGHSPTILHVATHGFYYTSDEAEHVDYLRGYKDAMALSGLALAGANAAWRGDELPDGVMSGILTADDIATLDLSATDMVVLSACRTGRGEVTAEGLFGLQRAFKKAGVNTLVMTLWDVSDVVTNEFMMAFYSHLPLCRWAKHEAFEAARADIRARYPEPYYWAAFIMVD